jgi:hypothetical protein
MVITESELRQLWRDGRHPLPAFPPGTRFSPSAQDFLKDHHLEIRFAEPAPPFLPPSQLPREATTYQLPFSLDALHALALLTAAEARRYQLPALAHQLDALAESVLGLRAAEQLGRDPAPPPPAPAAGAPFVPGPTDHAILHWLNFLRASAAQAATQAAAGGQPALAAALSRVSTAAADLGQRVLSGELGWTPLGDTSNR